MLKIIMLLFLFIDFTFAFKNVIIFGHGTDKNNAIQNVFKQAVQNEIGQYVNPNEIIKNDTILKKEFLDDANKFIKNYKIINSKKEKKIIEIEAQINIDDESILKKLTSLKIKLMQINKSIKDKKVHKLKFIYQNKFTNFNQFKKGAYDTIFKPLEKGNIYKVSILSLKSLNNEYLEKYKYFLEKYINEGYFPFILNLEISLNDNYYKNVKNFIIKNSEECNNSYNTNANFTIIKNWNSIYTYQPIFSVSSKNSYKLDTNCKLNVLKENYIKKLYKNIQNEYLNFQWKISLIDKNNNVLQSSTIIKTNDLSSYNGNLPILNYPITVNNKIYKREFIIDFFSYPLQTRDYTPTIYFGWENPINLGIIVFLKENSMKNFKKIKFMIESNKKIKKSEIMGFEELKELTTQWEKLKNQNSINGKKLSKLLTKIIYLQLNLITQFKNYYFQHNNIEPYDKLLTDLTYQIFNELTFLKKYYTEETFKNIDIYSYNKTMNYVTSNLFNNFESLKKYYFANAQIKKYNFIIEKLESIIMQNKNELILFKNLYLKNEDLKSYNQLLNNIIKIETQLNELN